MLLRTLPMRIVAALGLLSSFASAEEARFEYHPDPAADPAVTSVAIRGTFNAWGKSAMSLGEDNIWSITLDLSPGEHQYKYFVDGQWPSDMSAAPNGNPYDPAADDYADDGYGGKNAIRRIGGVTGAAPPPDAIPALAEQPANTARIHYHRPDGTYTSWGLHVWHDAAAPTDWSSPLAPAGFTYFGVAYDVPLADDAHQLGLIIHKGEDKDPGPDQFLDLTTTREAWILSGRAELFTEEPDVTLLALGDLTQRAAHWLTKDILAWNIPIPDDTDAGADGARFHLHAAPDGGLELTPDGVTGGATLDLTVLPNGLPAPLKQAFPHLATYTALRLKGDDIVRAPVLLRGQLAVSTTTASSPDGRKLKTAAGIQIPGVLDDLFATDTALRTPLGATWSGQTPTLRVWAPTAQNVRLLLYDTSGTTSRSESPSATLDMTRDGGVWKTTGTPDWNRKFYLYEVTVFVPTTGRVETNTVTDPYSRGLSANSTKSQIVNLNDADLKPDGWGTLTKPALAAPEDIVLYELHVRDFSSADPTVPDSLRGTFEAFTLESNGKKHLEQLADAGLTHVHLLPVFDIATVPEDRAGWPTLDLADLPGNSEEQQTQTAATSADDAYNWGYDPFHFGVPEGSYATRPDGPQRILEFRNMVQSLAKTDLRVVMDVVYNHTNASGQSDKSVLDKIVPGYYHRLDLNGHVTTSTCCQNTATEHKMMEKLMIDDLIHWAVDYKIDGFRFDLMGHHMTRNMKAARDALHALTPERDGVDGKSIYLYGEGWDFGEVQGGKRGENATQPNMAGTGIGTFNDRIRDAVRGGSPFTDRREQGYATGLFHAPNGRPESDNRHILGDIANLVRIGLAGNLADYELFGRPGRDFGGYTSDPQEAIQYASAHDNETLFDKIQLAAPADLPIDDRAQMQRFALSIIAVAQGIPFFHAGSDLLRSKSMDADSYNSGDWFNRVDWTGQETTWGAGLPIAEKNRDRWDIMRPLLANEDLAPTADQICATRDHVQSMLRLRTSTSLLRLRTADDIKQRVRFHAQNRDDGLIVLTVTDTVDPDLDPNHEWIAVLINPGPETTFGDGRWSRFLYELHPALVNAPDLEGATFDQPSGTFTLPARSVSVFVVAE